MDPKPSLLSPYCAKLCSKKAHFLDSPPRTRRDILDGSNHSWCEVTQMALGPDRQLVDPDDCQSGRACYVPWGARRAPQA